MAEDTPTGNRLLTRLEMAEEVGLDPELTRRYWRALGFVDADDQSPQFTQADLTGLRLLAGLLDSGAIGVDETLELTRVFGQSSARIAEAMVNVIERRLADVGEPPEERDQSTVAEAIAVMSPIVEVFIRYILRQHLRAAAERVRLEGGSVEGAVLTVGFADLVRFTSISRELDQHDLTILIGRFESLAAEVISAGGGRLVKAIGDEVMFTVPDPIAALALAFDLSAAVGADDSLPRLRIGLAHGPTIARHGDHYGPTVNLAHRIVELARPGTVVTDDDFHAAVGEDDGVTWKRLHGRSLRGIGRIRLWAVERAES